MKRHARLVWDQLSLYIPVVLMGVLALGTWWLVRNAPKGLVAAPVKAVSSKPDYFMRQFSVKNFDAQGKLQSEVQGRLARHYPATDTTEIEDAHMRSVGLNGLITVATANKAITNADGSDVRLFGNAVVTRTAQPGTPSPPPPMEFRGEYLHARTQPDRVESDQPVVLLRGNDRLTADKMQYDRSTQILQLQGRVKGVMLPGNVSKKPSRSR